MTYVTQTVDIDIDDVIKDNTWECLNEAIRCASTAEILQALTDNGITFSDTVDGWYESATDGQRTHMLNKILKHKDYCPKTVNMATVGEFVDAVWSAREVS